MTTAYDPHADWAREDREFTVSTEQLRQDETFKSIMSAAVRARCDVCEATR